MNFATSQGTGGHTGSDDEPQLSRPAAAPATPNQDLQMMASSPPRNFGLGTKRSRLPPHILTPRMEGQDNQDRRPSRRPRTADQSEDTGQAKGVAGALQSLANGARGCRALADQVKADSNPLHPAPQRPESGFGWAEAEDHACAGPSIAYLFPSVADSVKKRYEAAAASLEKERADLEKD